MVRAGAAQYAKGKAGEELVRTWLEGRGHNVEKLPEVKGKQGDFRLLHKTGKTRIIEVKNDERSITSGNLAIETRSFRENGEYRNFSKENVVDLYFFVSGNELWVLEKSFLKDESTLFYSENDTSFFSREVSVGAHYMDRYETFNLLLPKSKLKEYGFKPYYINELV